MIGKYWDFLLGRVDAALITCALRLGIDAVADDSAQEPVWHTPQAEFAVDASRSPDTTEEGNR